MHRRVYGYFLLTFCFRKSVSETEGIEQTFFPHELRSFSMKNFNFHTHVDAWKLFILFYFNKTYMNKKD